MTLPLPIDARAHVHVLLAHVLDVLVRRFGGVDVGLDGGVLCRQSKRVEAHREEHVEALPPLEPRERIRRHERIPVTNVEDARRVWVHCQRVPVRLVRLVRGSVELVRSPSCLPLGINSGCVQAAGFLFAVDWRRHRAYPLLVLMLANDMTMQNSLPGDDRGRLSRHPVVVELRGLEPLTSTLPVLRSPS